MYPIEFHLEEKIQIVRDRAQRIKEAWTPITEIPVEQQESYQPEDQDR